MPKYKGEIHIGLAGATRHFTFTVDDEDIEGMGPEEVSMYLNDAAREHAENMGMVDIVCTGKE